MSRLHHIVRIAVLLATTFTAAVASADAVCIDESAKRALACPGAGASFDGTMRVGASFRATVPGPRAVAAAKPRVPKANDVPRDTRTIRLEARVKGLLVAEVASIEKLFATTRPNAPDRLQLARRLADAYVELESAAFRDKTEAELRRDAHGTKDPTKAREEQANVNAADKTMRSARKRAIELYTLVANEYPAHPKIDEVLYYLAYEHEQAGDLKAARAAYYDLIKKAPTSHWIPNAYLAFGELFFVEAQGDPSKWDLAAQAYGEVIKYPAPQNKVQGYAFYKLAYVHWNKGELDRALDAFKKTVDFGAANPTLPGATRLAESARRDAIPVYALKGDPKLAYAFLKSISADPAGSNEKTFKMMDDLGAAYLDSGHYPEAITLYKDLGSRDRPRSCAYEARIAEAVMAMRSGDKDAIKKELDALLDLASRTKASSADAGAKGSSPDGPDYARVCGNRTAALVAETAMAWHLEAVGSAQSQRGTNDKKTITLAAHFYKRTLDAFSATELASYEFPRLVREDWPTRYKLAYALADLLYSQKEWAKCGPAFDAVVAEDPKGPEAPNAAYAAGLCYQAAYEEAHKADAGRRGLAWSVLHGASSSNASSALRPKELSPEQAAMVRAFDRSVCLVRPAAADKSGQEQLVEVKYARARTYFEAQHWEEAALAFREIALQHPESDSAGYAARLYLESANVMSRHLGKPACEDEMAAHLPKLVELHCTGANAAKNAEHCMEFRYVDADLMRLRAQRLVERGDRAPKGSAEALADYERGGSLYFELFQTHCQDPVGGAPHAERCDEIAYNAARAFQAARLVARAISARRALLAFDERTRASSPLARKAVYEIGASYQAIAVYDQAAAFFERYARIDPRAENADRALSDAVLLRLGLGQDQEAIKDAEDFIRSYGATKPALAGSIAFAIGAHHAEKEEWDKARLALSGPTARATIDRAPPDIRVLAHAMLGRALSKLGPTYAAQARGEYAKVRSLWADPAATEQKIRAAYPAEDDAQRDRRIGRAVEAVGEALFFAAEERRSSEVDALRFPEYRGPGDKASVKAHVDGKVKDWYLKKKAAIEKVEAEYAKLLDLRPVPPPRWVIAAGSRAGLMWGDFVDDFRRAPIPKAWRGTDLEQVYTTSIDLASEPYKRDHAKPALKRCLELSTKYQYFDALSRACEVWLARNYKDEYHVVDELRGAPSLANSGLSEKAPPVLVSGAFAHGAISR